MCTGYLPPLTLSAAPVTITQVEKYPLGCFDLELKLLRKYYPKATYTQQQLK